MSAYQAGEVRQLIARLFDLLPPTGAVWPLDERTRWLRAASTLVGLYAAEPRHTEVRLRDGEIIFETVDGP